MKTNIAFKCILTLSLIAIVFTTTADGELIRNDLILFLQITCIFYPAAAFGIASSAMFQGVGKGTYALVATLLRTIVLAITIALVFVLVFDSGIVGIWWALVIANLIGSAVSFVWGKLYINKLLRNIESSKSI